MSEDDKIDFLIWQTQINVSEISKLPLDWEQLKQIKKIIKDLQEIEAKNEY